MSRSRRARPRRKPAPKRAPKQGSRSRWKGVSAAALAGAVALVVSLTSIVDWVQRKLDPPEPALIDTRLLSVDLMRTEEQLGTYLRDTKQSLEGLTAVERREPGLVFNVRVRLVGVVGKQFPLTWTLTDTRRNRRLEDYLYKQEAVTFEPKGVAHARAWPIWVPYPPRRGSYRLDVVLADDKRQPVDQRSSDAFRLNSIPALG